MEIADIRVQSEASTKDKTFEEKQEKVTDEDLHISMSADELSISHSTSVDWWKSSRAKKNFHTSSQTLPSKRRGNNMIDKVVVTPDGWIGRVAEVTNYFGSKHYKIVDETGVNSPLYVTPTEAKLLRIVVDD